MKKTKKIPQEILKGSSILLGNSAHKNRVQFMVENIEKNKAFLHEVQRNPNVDVKELSKKLAEKYSQYRENWDGQPRRLIQSKDDLLNGAKDDAIPLCVDIEITSMCDLACSFCYRESIATPDKFMTEDLFKSLINQVAEIGVPSIKLNWRGEPLLHPKIAEFVAYAKEKGILEVIINTNATKLTPALSEKLIDAGIDFIIYSFDGGTEATYERMRPGRFEDNLFENVYENIKQFHRLRETKGALLPRTKIQMILTKETYSEQDSFYSLFEDYVDEVTVTPYSERGGDIDVLTAKERSIYDHLIHVNNLPTGTPYLRDSNGNISVADSRKPCEQPFQRLMITYDGRVAMCCYDWGAMHPVGYVDSSSFPDPHADKRVIIKNVLGGKRGFELMSQVKLPPVFNTPELKVDKILNIWWGKEISKVRRAHVDGEVDTIEICKGCTFKDTYNWIN